MTRKDFDFIAETLRERCPVVRDRTDRAMARAQWDEMCEHFAGKLKDAYPRFNMARFLTACLPPKCGYQ